MSTPAEIIFRQQEGAWVGQLGAGIWKFPNANPGEIYRQMLREQPGVRIGFRASDCGPYTVALCLLHGFGDVIWMKTAQERGR